MPLESEETEDRLGGGDSLARAGAVPAEGVEDAGGQRKRRNRRAMISGAMSMVARSVQVGTTLVTVPLTLKYLGTERFGLWMTISSVLAMAAFADFGIGNGVLNTVSEAFGRDDAPGIRQVVSSGFAVLTGIAACLLAVFFAVYPFVSWGDVFRVSSALARAEAGPALVVFAVCFAANISLDVVQRTQFGIQQGYRYAGWQMCGNLVGFLGVLACVKLQGGLPLLVLAIAGGPLLFTLLNAVHFFTVSRPDLRPDLRPGRGLVSRGAIEQIARLGAMFFVLQVVVSIAYSADNFIIARTLGAVRVPEYAIPQRMFGLISMMVAMLVTPLWAAYGEAVARGDVAWVRATLRRSLLLVGGGAALGAVVLFSLAHRLLGLWVGGRVHPSTVLLAGLAVWSVMDCCGNALSMFLNGASIMKFQIVVASVFGLGCVVLKVVLVRRFGVEGVPWATIVSYGLLTVVPYGIYVPRVLRELETRQRVAEELQA